MTERLLERVVAAERGSGRTRVRVEACRFGPDLLLVVGGGGSHLGAVSLAEPRTDHGEPRTGTLGALGHREPDLVADIARRLSRDTGRRVVVAGGIHVEDARPEEIREILRNARAVAGEIAATLCADD